MPTSDPAARTRILALLERIAAGGIDPIAALRDTISRTFGRAAHVALPEPSGAGDARRGMPAAHGEGVPLEPLLPLRRPTLWPQRPKLLPGELFSSWLWRTAVAAGAEPRPFALDVLGTRHADIDRSVSDAALLRLALATGQRFEDLRAGTLLAAEQEVTPRYAGRQTSLEAALARSPAAAVQHLALHDGQQMLTTSSSPRRSVRVALLQYCPACLAEDGTPRFRRGWRFAYEVACPWHRCRLHDGCWQCGAPVALLAQRTASAEPLCSGCSAALADAPRRTAHPAALAAQRTAMVLLYAQAVEVEAGRREPGLGGLADWLAQSGPGVAAREQALARLAPSHLREWLGTPVGPFGAWRSDGHAHADAFRRLFAEFEPERCVPDKGWSDG